MRAFWKLFYLIEDKIFGPSKTEIVTIDLARYSVDDKGRKQRWYKVLLKDDPDGGVRTYDLPTKKDRFWNRLKFTRLYEKGPKPKVELRYRHSNRVLMRIEGKILRTI